MNLELTDNEVKALKILLYADIKIYRDRKAHAESHGDTYHDSYGVALSDIAEKLEK